MMPSPEPATPTPGPWRWTRSPSSWHLESGEAGGWRAILHTDTADTPRPADRDIIARAPEIPALEERVKDLLESRDRGGRQSGLILKRAERAELERDALRSENADLLAALREALRVLREQAAQGMDNYGMMAVERVLRDAIARAEKREPGGEPVSPPEDWPTGSRPRRPSADDADERQRRALAEPPATPTPGPRGLCQRHGGDDIACRYCWHDRDEAARRLAMVEAERDEAREVLRAVATAMRRTAELDGDACLVGVPSIRAFLALPAVVAAVDAARAASPPGGA